MRRPRGPADHVVLYVRRERREDRLDIVTSLEAEMFIDFPIHLRTGQRHDWFLAWLRLRGLPMYFSETRVSLQDRNASSKRERRLAKANSFG
jgi:hypothetical protein